MIITEPFALPDIPEMTDLLVLADWYDDQNMDTTELRMIITTKKSTYSKQ